MPLRPVRHGGRAGGRFLLRRPLSLHSVAGERVKLLVEARGEGSAVLAAGEVGDTLPLAGPLGSGFRLEGVAAALLVAGGIGAAPLQFVADELVAAEAPVVGAFGFRDAAQARLVGAFEIDRLWVASDDGSVAAGHRRRAARHDRRARRSHRVRLRAGGDGRRPGALGRGARSRRLRVARGAHGVRHGRLSRVRRAHARRVSPRLRRRPCSPWTTWRRRRDETRRRRRRLHEHGRAGARRPRARPLG